MTVEAKLFATLKFKLGVGKLSVQAENPMSVRQLLHRISEELDHDILPYLLDENDGIRPGTMILVGGKNIHHLDGLDTVIEDSDVAIFPPSGGG
jgi:molybdopterin synthase sulfur carrier subunit